jgi:V8-like Glu-specific endopeptidase
MANVYRKTTKEEFRHPIMDQVMPVIAFEGREGLVAGTCVLIAPFLALTARHVVEAIHKHFGKDAWKGKNVNLDVYPIQFNTGRIWYVSQVFAWVGTDIAFLRLQPRSEQAKTPDSQFLKITVDPPAIGSEITALGYPKTEIAVERNDHEVTALKLNIYPAVSTGTVTKIHRSFRDKTMVNFPAFSVNASFPAGMSGGAVFNDKKELCGLVCSGLECGQDRNGDYSNAVSIWPSMLIKMKFNSGDYLPTGLEPDRQYSALELAQIGYIKVIGHERIEFFTHENGSAGVRRKHF